MKLISFDIFDTLITRKTATPKGIFSLIEYELQNNPKYKDFPLHLKNNFFNLRLSAEQHVREMNYFQEDISFVEIYNCLQNNTKLSIDQLELLKQLELDIEYDNTIAIPENIAKVHDYFNKGYNIILISDMYLSEATIRNLLLKVDQVFANIDIFVSSEYLQTKASGNLFQFVKERLDVSFTEWKHYGDNLHSDVKMPKKLGIAAEHYRYITLEQYEKNLIAADENNLDNQLQIGISKNIRLLNNLNDKAGLGAGIAGNMLFIYAHWVVEQALLMKLENLYFIARDGYIIKELADIIIKFYNYNINTHYIYGSRYAWRVLLLDENAKISDITWGVNKYDTFSVMDFCSHFALQNNTEFIKLLPNKYQNLNRNINENQIKFLKKYIDNNLNILQFVQQHVKQTKQIILKYMQQEVDLSNNNFAMVDLRGTGFSFVSLANFLNKLKIFGKFNLFLLERPSNSFKNRKSLSKENYVNFYTMHNSTLEYYHDVLEALARAPHGQTLYYKQEENSEKIIPVLEEKEGVAIKEYGFDDYLNGIKLYATEYLEELKNRNINFTGKLDIFYNYYRFLKYYPDQKTATLIGDMPFVPFANNQNLTVYAPEYSKSRLFKTGWIAGSYARKNNVYYKKQQYKKNNNKMFKIYYSKSKNLFYIDILKKRIRIK
ncbi:HAD family hydrolase [Rickettsiales bacterium LUAb2]